MKEVIYNIFCFCPDGILDLPLYIQTPVIT